MSVIKRFYTCLSIYVNPLNYDVPQKTVWGNLVLVKYGH